MNAHTWWNLADNSLRLAIVQRAFPNYPADDPFFKSQLASPFVFLHKDVKVGIYDSPEWREGRLSADARALTYEVIKVGKHWQAVKDGKPVCRPTWSYPTSFYTKKAAREWCEEDAAYDARIARETAEDIAGNYHWTESEEKQIEDYARQLDGNADRWTFAGKFPLQEIGRQQHAKDAEVLAGPRQGWLDPDGLFREKRRVMAARTEAFKRAGLTL